jgi:hypothetical protein
MHQSRVTQTSKCKTHTLPILMHYMHISTNYVSSVINAWVEKKMESKHDGDNTLIWNEFIIHFSW